MTTKTDLARDCFNQRDSAWHLSNISTKITGGDGVVRPRPEFRNDVVTAIMQNLSTTKQNAGTYFSRIFKEQNGGIKAVTRKKRPTPGVATRKKGPFPRRGKKKPPIGTEWLNPNPKKRSGSHSLDASEQDMGTGFLENLDITPDGDIQAPIKRIDKPTAIYLGNEAMELIKVLEEYHGLEISRSKSRYENGFYQMDIRFSVKDSDGNTQTPEAQDFIDCAAVHEIPTELLFKEFVFTGISSKVDGKTHSIIGWKRRATKNKVLFLRDGKRFVTRVDSMKRYLSKAGLIDG